MNRKVRFAPPALYLHQIQVVDYCYVRGKFEDQKSCEMQTIYAITKGN